MTYYSQVETGQDRWLLEEVYPHDLGGFFVDIGAGDGVNLSNTYALEQKGWTGICIEPRESCQASLKANRQCHISNYCVGDRFRIVEFIEAGLDGHLSGVKETLGDYMGQPVTGQEVRKSMVTLDYILEMYDAPTIIDYVSIDTEGNEYEILRAYPFNRLIRAITVEHNFQEPKRSQMLALLTQKGYKRVREARWDDFYVHKSLL